MKFKQRGARSVARSVSEREQEAQLAKPTAHLSEIGAHLSQKGEL